LGDATAGFQIIAPLAERACAVAGFGELTKAQLVGQEAAGAPWRHMSAR
jgi:hypothetical protein